MAEVGRPTGYKPEFCDLVIELGKKGIMPKMWALHCGVDDPDTVRNWTKSHPEFLVAYRRAKLWCENYFLNLGASKANGENPQASDKMITFFLKAGFGWSEKDQLELSGSVEVLSASEIIKRNATKKTEDDTTDSVQ